MTLSLYTKANTIRNGTVTECGEDVVFLATRNIFFTKGANEHGAHETSVSARRVKLASEIMNIIILYIGHYVHKHLKTNMLH